MMAGTTIRKRMLYSMRVLLAAALLLAPLWVQAQSAAGLSAADKHAISSYSFNEDNFKRLVGATREAHTMGLRQKQFDYSQVHSLDDLANLVVDQDPRARPLLQKYGFTPREYLLANLALMNAGMVVQAKAQPEARQYVDKSRVNPANVSFYEAHEQQIAQLQSELADGK